MVEFYVGKENDMIKWDLHMKSKAFEQGKELSFEQRKARQIKSSQYVKEK